MALPSPSQSNWPLAPCLRRNPREADLAQLSPNLLGRRPEPDDAELRLGRRRLSRRGLRGAATALRSPRGEQRKSGDDSEARHERAEAQPAEGRRSQGERAEDQLNLTGSRMLKRSPLILKRLRWLSHRPEVVLSPGSQSFWFHCLP